MIKENTIEAQVLRKSYKTVYNYFHKIKQYSICVFDEDINTLFVSDSAAGITYIEYAIIFSKKMRAIKVVQLVKNAEIIKSYSQFLSEVLSEN